MLNLPEDDNRDGNVTEESGDAVSTVYHGQSPVQSDGKQFHA
jgi:hypothetical protein